MTSLRILTIFLVIGIVLAQRKSSKNSRRTTTERMIFATAENMGLSEPEDEISENCPEPNGFFADAEQCDKYYACHAGVLTEKLCPDGMVFNDFAIDQEKCDLPYNLDCSQRPKLQPPKPSINCPRLNGYFAHEEPTNCDTFFYCVDGMFNKITCPQGLVFNPKTGICTWADEAGRSGCSSSDVFQFSCPKVSETEAQTHPRYADPDDCQFFYVCINGEVPRRNGCKLGQVFNDDNKKCEWSRKVPECSDWYKDRLTEAELEELENPKPKIKNPMRPKGPSRRKHPKMKPVEIVEDEE